MTRARDIADSTKTLSVDGGTIKLDGNYPVGSDNVALGNTAFDSITATVQASTALGSGSLETVDTGIRNTAVGRAALRYTTSGSYNVAMGSYALQFNTTANYNTAVGYQAGYSNTTGTQTTAVGAFSAKNNTTGQITAIGYGALVSNTTASNNTAVGYEAGYYNTTGRDNTHVGTQAGYTNASGRSNTFIGDDAGKFSTSSFNTYIGKDAGTLITSGEKNTILGSYNGNQGGLDIRTSSSNIVLSDGDGNPRVLVGNSGHTILSSHGFSTVVNSGDKHVVSNGTTGNYTCVFENVTTGSPYGLFLQFPNLSPNNTGNTFISAADSSTNRFLVFSNGNVVNTNNSYGAISDVKLKENIVDASSQWDDIKALTVRKYSMKSDNLDAPNMLGVIAQEIEAAGMGGLVFESPDKDDDLNDLGTVTKQVNYSVLYMKAVKALQEAMDRIETLETQNDALEARITALEAV